MEQVHPENPACHLAKPESSVAEIARSKHLSILSAMSSDLCTRKERK
jgi:hypothetical protein